MTFQVADLHYRNPFYFFLIKAVLFRDRLIAIKKSPLFHEQKAFSH
ncbi:hypothetical protein B4133_2337 [Bacillus altitudinis]|nr:hypothetical protein B4133_2337 [Bacillus altitudinis]